LAAAGDPWQGRGVGRSLPESLAAAAGDAGIRILHATVLAENAAALGLAKSPGPQLRIDGTSALREVVWVLGQH